jgi:hypothetical protein
LSFAYPSVRFPNANLTTIPYSSYPLFPAHNLFDSNLYVNTPSNPVPFPEKVVELNKPGCSSSSLLTQNISDTNSFSNNRLISKFSSSSSSIFDHLSLNKSPDSVDTSHKLWDLNISKSQDSSSLSLNNSNVNNNNNAHKQQSPELLLTFHPLTNNNMNIHQPTVEAVISPISIPNNESPLLRHSTSSKTNSSLSTPTDYYSPSNTSNYSSPEISIIPPTPQIIRSNSTDPSCPLHDFTSSSSFSSPFSPCATEISIIPLTPQIIQPNSTNPSFSLHDFAFPSSSTSSSLSSSSLNSFALNPHPFSSSAFVKVKSLLMMDDELSLKNKDNNNNNNNNSNNSNNNNNNNILVMYPSPPNTPVLVFPVLNEPLFTTINEEINFINNEKDKEEETIEEEKKIIDGNNNNNNDFDYSTRCVCGSKCLLNFYKPSYSSLHFFPSRNFLSPPLPLFPFPNFKSKCCNSNVGSLFNEENIPKNKDENNNVFKKNDENRIGDVALKIDNIFSLSSSSSPSSPSSSSSPSSPSSPSSSSSSSS